MNFLQYNIIPICLILFAAFLVFMDKEGWGWCIFAATITAAVPSKITVTDDEDKEEG